MTAETQPLTTDAERAEFERRMGGANFKRNENGDYVNEFVQCKWWGWCAHADAVRELGWQAARRTPAPVGVESVAWAATSEDGVVEALGMNQSRRFDTPLYTAEQVLAMGRAEITSDERLEGVKRAARNVTRGGKEAAIAFLKRAGIMGEDGKIKPKFAAHGIKQGGQRD
jgi:hypothetical protein